MTDKLWHKGTDKQPSIEEVEAFTVGNDPQIDRLLLVDDCWASIAHAMALQKAGILTDEEFSQLRKALLGIIERHETSGITVERSQEDCHTAIEQELTKELGDLGKKIHTGRSRNDQVLTALRLFTKRRLLEVFASAIDVAETILVRAKASTRVPMRGYSHTRAAMPTTLAIWLGSFVEMLLDDLSVLRAAYDLNDRSPLGTAAGFGSVIAIDRELEQELLGFNSIQVNALSCQTSRGKVERDVVHGLAGIQGTLDVLARDLIFYSTEEFGFVTLPQEFTTGSSIMPQKRNPDVLELIRGSTGIVEGALAQLSVVGSGLTSGYHRDYQLLKEPLITALDAVAACLAMVARITDGLVFDEDAMRASCTRELYAADVALAKALAGVPFRDAYKAAMEELAFLEIDDGFINATIASYKTIGSMGNSGLERYDAPIAALSEWVTKQERGQQDSIERLRGAPEA